MEKNPTRKGVEFALNASLHKEEATHEFIQLRRAAPTRWGRDSKEYRRSDLTHHQVYTQLIADQLRTQEMI